MPAYNGNVARAQISARMDGQQVVNVLHFDEVPVGATGWNPDRLGQLIASIASVWSLNVANFVSIGYVLERIAAYHLSGPGGVVVEEVIAGVNGNVAGSAQLPNNVAACATIGTARAGRSYRGRTYFAGLTAGQVIFSTLNQAAADVINDELAEGLAAFTTAGFRLGVYSQFTANAPRIAGEFTPATSWALRDRIVDSRRTRLPGRGQ